MKSLNIFLNKYGLIIGLFILVTLLIMFNEMSSKKEVNILMGQTNYKVEVASSYDQKIKGLSLRESLCKECGMLFVYKKPGIYNFWMKDMNFSIDIIWLNEDKEVIFIKENLSPETYPRTFGTNLKSKYVLEFNPGFVKQHNLKFGDKINF